MPNSDLYVTSGVHVTAEHVILPVISLAVAAACSTVVQVVGHDYRVPRITADASAAWVAEGETIPSSGVSADEIICTPSKVAGLAVISSELAADTDPAAAATVGDSLARDISRKLDEAFFGSRGVSLVQPAGLSDLPAVGAAGVTVIQDPGDTGLDPWAEAINAAAALGVVLDSFACSPDVALRLATLKESASSLRPLLGNDPTAAGALTVLGVPLLVSPAITPGVCWGLPKNRSTVVMRKDAEITVDGSRYFDSDQVGVRAICRVGFVWPQPAAIIKITGA